jgi:hypothetical protein
LPRNVNSRKSTCPVVRKQKKRQRARHDKPVFVVLGKEDVEGARIAQDEGQNRVEVVHEGDVDAVAEDEADDRRRRGSPSARGEEAVGGEP